MDEDTIGFAAKAPVSAWNKRLGIDAPGIFRALAKATIAGLNLDPRGAIVAAIDSTAALKLRALPPAELAWLLVRRALARAMAKLSVEALRRHGVFVEPEEFDEPVARLDGQLDVVSEQVVQA